MVANIGALEAGTVIPRGREFGALVAFRSGRGVVLYDGELRWGRVGRITNWCQNSVT